MGLLDVLHGMQNGPHGRPQPTAPGTSGGGMSPMTMALIGLLAYKALKSSGGLGNLFGGGQTTTAPAAPANTTASGGGLGGLLGGLLGGGASSNATASMLSRGLSTLVHDLQNSGHGAAVNSWVGTGQNQPISPSSLESALGADTIDTLSKQSGMSRDELLQGLSQYLPGLVDHLTPNGRLPDEHELARAV